MRRDAEATPTLRSAAVNATRADRNKLDVPWSNLVKRLEDRLGVGDEPQLRRALYHKLLRLCDSHGISVYRHVRDCVRTATSKQDPGRWFTAAVVRRLRDIGFEI